MTNVEFKRPFIWVTGVILALTLVVVCIVIFSTRQTTQQVNSFQSCKDAGGAILESYPEQCMKDGRSFTNPEQSLSGEKSEYVGLTEEAALSKAAAENKAARVVRRDDEDLPVTMDFSPGRLNLYVQDGEVYMVQVEGN